MGNQRPEEAIKLATFGRRKIRPRVCVADGEQHIRKFLGEALEELGFITCECTQVGELSAVLDGQLPDLVVMGLSAGGIEAAAMLKALAARAFDGKVLLLGPRDSPVVTAVQELGEQLGIAMLPALATPFGSEGLRNSVATLRPVEAPPSPPVDVAEALSVGLARTVVPAKNSTRARSSLCGAEALIRLRHPTWGVVPPAYFIPDEGDPHLRVFIGLRDWAGDGRLAQLHYTTPVLSKSPSTCRPPIFRTRNRSRVCAASNAGSPGVRRAYHRD